MKEQKRILFISQEIYPYLDQETPIRLLNRQLPELFQSHGNETRTFMPSSAISMSVVINCMRSFDFLV